MTKKPTLLCILDGVGIAPLTKGNAVLSAKAPFLKQLFSDYPNCELRTDGEFVGLPEGQMGNSEVGHLTIGSGQVFKQSLLKINQEFQNNTFAKLESYKQFAAKASGNRAIHLIGLLSDGGVHSHGYHALELCKILNKIGKPIFVHAITDGRDVGVRAATKYAADFANQIEKLENVHLATVIGRFYAMDRDNRWERVNQAWSLFTQGAGQEFNNLTDLLKFADGEVQSDEFIPACKLTLDDNLDPTVQAQDSVFFYNFRADRMREITSLFIGNDIDGFDYDKININNITTMTSYNSKFDGQLDLIYPSVDLKGGLSETVSKAGLTQLHTAETEKYPHITYYFNGGIEVPFENEDRILINSPKDVMSYDEKPEMSLPELTDKLTAAIETGKYDFVALNIANGDMVGHTGNLEAVMQAVDSIDTNLKRILNSIEKMGGQALIIADHGNAEEMIKDGKPCTTHSTNPVPCIYFGDKKLSLKDGSLADVAPTMLDLMGLEASDDMTGKSFVN